MKGGLFVNKLKKLFGVKSIVGSAVVAGSAVAAAVPAYCADGVGYIQSSWVAGLLPSVTADVGTMMPIGIGIMALFLGCRVVPKIVYSFMH